MPCSPWSADYEHGRSVRWITLCAVLPRTSPARSLRPREPMMIPAANRPGWSDRSRRPRHADWTGRVVERRQADGAERHSRDATPSARAHDQQLSIVGRGQQRVASAAVAEPPQDGHLRVVLLPPADRILELLPQLVGTAQAAWRVGQGADGQNRGPT